MARPLRLVPLPLLLLLAPALAAAAADGAASTAARASSADFEDAPAGPAALAAPGALGQPGAPVGAGEAQPAAVAAPSPSSLAQAVGGLVAEVRQAQEAATEALREEALAGNTDAAERTPAVRLLRSRIEAARAAEALLRLENAELRQELGRWRDAASRVAAHEARVAELLSLREASAGPTLPPLSLAATTGSGAAATPPAAAGAPEAVSAGGAGWGAVLLQEAGQLLQAEQPWAALAGRLLLLAGAAAALLLAAGCCAAGAGAGNGLATGKRQALASRPLDLVGRAAAAAGYGAVGPLKQRPGGSGGRARGPPAGLASAATSARDLGRALGLLPYAVELSELQVSDVITGGEIYLSLQVGATLPVRTEALRPPEGRTVAFRDALVVEVWRFGGPLVLRVVDCYPSREVIAARLELPPRELVRLLQEERERFGFDLEGPGASLPVAVAAVAVPAAGAGGGVQPRRARPRLSARLRARPSTTGAGGGALAAAAAAAPPPAPEVSPKLPPFGFIDEEDEQQEHCATLPPPRRLASQFWA